MSPELTSDAYSEAVQGGVLGEEIFKLLVKVSRKIDNDLSIEIEVEKVK
jgi:hypothetical protein